MVCIIQLALVAFAAWALKTPAIRCAGMIVRRPHTIYIGLVLLIQAPVALLSGFAVGAAEGFKAAQVGEVQPDPRRIQKKYIWLDPAIVGSAIAISVAVALSGVRPDLPEYAPPEEVAGVRDLVAEERNRRAAEHDEVEEWRGVRDPVEVDDGRYRT